MRIKSSKMAFCLGVSAFALSGCAGGSGQQLPPASFVSTSQGPGEQYVIGPLDSLTIFVWRNPELGAEVQVRPDGRITTPLIQDMVDSLRDFVNADIPFRKETRLDRVEALQDLMDQPDVPPSERYRLVMERFKTEAEYGQTVNAYADTEVIGGTEMKLNFVNIGRVAFMAQNIAGDRSFVWDNQAREWVELDSSFNSAVQDVILMAEKAQQPEMVIVPVFANQGAE